MPQAKPFCVNTEWIDYAHGPGAEDGQPMATELVELPVVNGSVLIPTNRRDLVEEVVSVAELYTSDSSLQDDDRLWFRVYPTKLIKRARKWLREIDSESPTLWRPDPLPPQWDNWNPALRGAFRKGWECAKAGGAERDCPYQDHRTPSGRLSWSRSFILAWGDGFRSFNSREA